VTETFFFSRAFEQQR